MDLILLWLFVVRSLKLAWVDTVSIRVCRSAFRRLSLFAIVQTARFFTNFVFLNSQGRLSLDLRFIRFYRFTSNIVWLRNSRFASVALSFVVGLHPFLLQSELFHFLSFFSCSSFQLCLKFHWIKRPKSCAWVSDLNSSLTTARSSWLILCRFSMYLLEFLKPLFDTHSSILSFHLASLIACHRLWHCTWSSIELSWCRDVSTHSHWHHSRIMHLAICKHHIS